MARLGSADRASAASVRHLFTHLRDAGKLRSNPLAADFFCDPPEGVPNEDEAASVVAIRERVLWACELRRQLDRATQPALAERYYAIVVRCDLEGEARKAVANDLGISLRHFSRDRRVARERVVQLLTEELHRSRSEMVDAHRASIARAIVLAELGSGAQAVRELEGMAASAASADDRLEALSTLAEVHREWGRYDQAQAVLDVAAGEAARNDKPFSSRLIARSMLVLARTELAAEQGEFAKSQRGFSELASVLPHLMVLGVRGAPEVVVRILRAQVWDTLERGQLAETLRYATIGLEVSASVALPPSVRADFLHAQVLALHDKHAISGITARARFLELLRAAQAAGWVAQSAKLCCSLGEVYGVDESNPHLIEAKRLARQHGGQRVRRTVYLASSMNALLAGSRAQAETEFEEAMRYGRGTMMEGIIASIIRSRIMIANGRLESAFAVLGGTYATTKTIGNVRMQGALLREMAGVQLKCKRLADASDLIKSSLPIIERHGSPSSLLLALHVQKQIAQSR